MNVDRLAVLAHELRSPVAALSAIAAAYAGSDTAHRQRLLELAGTAARNVERLVAEASVASVRLEPLDVGAIARDAAEAAVLVGAAVRVDVAAGLPLVAGDAGRLRQALDNLIENAVGHSPPGAEVHVSVGAGEGHVVLSVSDRGEGIPEGALARVFDAGARFTDARPGSGLGLAIVRAIAAAHGGSVEVASAPAQGATFRLVLPACAAGA